MRMDYHTHTHWSNDGHSVPVELCRAALRRGITHLAITDHHDPAKTQWTIADLNRYRGEHERLRRLFPELSLAAGIELDYRRHTWPILADLPRRLGMDVALLSLHYVEDIDPWEPRFFEGRTREQAYERHLRETLAMLTHVQGSFVLAHMTYVCKFAPYPSPAVRYADYPDIIDAMLRLLVDKGIALEVNTSGLHNGAGLLPGLDVLKRYRQLGGELVTMGSDAHTLPNLGYALGDAREALLAAGFTYVSAYRQLTPYFVRI